MARDFSQDFHSPQGSNPEAGQKRSLQVRVRCDIADQVRILHRRALDELFALCDLTQQYAETFAAASEPEPGSRKNLTRLTFGGTERFAAFGEFVSLFFYVCHERQILMLFAFDSSAGPRGGGGPPRRGGTPPASSGRTQPDRFHMRHDTPNQNASRLTVTARGTPPEAAGVGLCDLRAALAARPSLNTDTQGRPRRGVRVFVGLEYHAGSPGLGDVQSLIAALQQEASSDYDLAFAAALREKNLACVTRAVSWSALLQAGHMQLTHAATWFECSASGLSVLACTSTGVNREARSGIHRLVASLISRKYATTLSPSPLLLVLSQQGLGDFLNLDLAKPDAMADLLARYGVRLGQLSRDQRLCISQIFGQSRYYVVRFDNGCEHRIAKDLERVERRDTSARRAACLSGGKSDSSRQRFLVPDLDFLIDPASLELTIVPTSLQVRKD